MASGVSVEDDCKQVFNEIKLRKTHRYVVFRMSDDLKSIVIEKKSEPEATYEDFVGDLKGAEAKKECRYAIFDCEYMNNEGQPRNKLAFFMWSPDTAVIKQKMLYASSKDALKKTLGQGMSKEIQATDHGDLAWENVVEHLNRAT